MNIAYAFGSEWLKRKRSLSSLMVVAGAFFTPLIIVVARIIHAGQLAAEVRSARFWERLWNSAWESMAIFLLPLGVMLATSLVTQLEFRNNSWKQLHTTPQSYTRIFLVKLAVIMTMVLQFFLLFNLGVYLAGIIPPLLSRGVSLPGEPIRYGIFLRENGYFLVDCLPIVALQYAFSLQARNFLAPLGAGLLLWILSLATFRWQYGYLIPYGYCGMHYLGSQVKEPPISVHSLAIAYFVVITALGYLFYLTKKEKG